MVDLFAVNCPAFRCSMRWGPDLDQPFTTTVRAVPLAKRAPDGALGNPAAKIWDDIWPQIGAG